MFAPFLEKIWIAAGFRDYALQCIRIYCHTLCLSRLFNSNHGGFRRQWADFREIEQSLCVGFRSTHPTTQLWQSSADQNHRQATL